MNIPIAKCPHCGAIYQGWALFSGQHQTCGSCGSNLKITAGGQTFEGYSPFTAEKLTIDFPQKPSAPHAKQGKENKKEK